MGIKYHGKLAEEHPNGSRSFRTDDPYATLSKVENCPCEDGERRNAFPTAYPDTFFSIPACVYVGKKTVSGFLAFGEEGYRFIVVRGRTNSALIKEPS